VNIGKKGNNYNTRKFISLIGGGMMDGLRSVRLKHKGRLQSIFLIFVLVAMNIVFIIPLNMPNAEAPGTLVHLGSTFEEDGKAPYDMDGQVNNVILWDYDTDHWIPDNYTVDAGYTLVIPALNFMGDTGSANEITFLKNGTKLDVWGKLLTFNDGNPFTKTFFWGGGDTDWQGLQFRPGASGNITDCLFQGADKAVAFSWTSNLLSPGITDSTFREIGTFGVTLSLLGGVLNIENCVFEDTFNSGIGLDIDDVGPEVTVRNSQFFSHGTDLPSLRIRYANVKVEGCSFSGNNRPGNGVHIGKQSSGTVLTDCNFYDGAIGNYFIEVNGSSPLFDNCSFDTTGGRFSVWATVSAEGHSSHPVLLNPTADMSPGFWDDTFDNSTLNATGNTTITLQWYMNVVVIDTFGNIITNAPVWVVDRNDDPATPSSKSTESDGWARWFIVTELKLYNSTTDYFSPFNVSSQNNSMMGYADPTPVMDMSKEITVIVPINPIPNPPPIVSWLPTPSSVQSGLIPLEFRLEDPNPSDDGNLSILVEFSIDGTSWNPATSGPGSDFENLFNNTLYYFIWDSSNITDLFNIYSSTVYIRITPYDRGGPGPSSQTGTFTVDNEAPFLLTIPTVIATDTTAIINWTVHENANASVWWGLNPDLTDETTGSTDSTSQSVTLTNLNPGRNYTYVVNSTDLYGNVFSSLGKFTFTFETQIRIQLYEGWNMISLAPNPINSDVEFQLSSISGQFDAVQIYDSTDPDDPWKHYVPGKLMGNDLTDLYPDYGIWIKMKNDAVLIVNHNIPPSGDPPLVMAIEYGWNFVGYPSVTTQSVSQALSGFVWDEVQMYDAATDAWYFNDGPGGDVDTLAQMELGRGYWIHCPIQAGGIWSLSYI
jgi:hypothetical protein